MNGIEFYDCPSFNQTGYFYSYAFAKMQLAYIYYYWFSMLIYRHPHVQIIPKMSEKE